MMYDYSYMGVLDGTNGELLWSINCSMGAMASPITVKSSKAGHDGMLFLASGCDETAHHVIKKETEKMEDIEVTDKHDDDASCLAAHWGVERTMCLAGRRSERHVEESDGNYIVIDEDGNQNYVAGGDYPPPPPVTDSQVYRPLEIDLSDIEDYIPKDLWVARNETDSFPDPWTDPRSFIQDYCRVPYDRLINKVYFLTPNMVKLGKIKPVVVNYPYVYSKFFFNSLIKNNYKFYLCYSDSSYPHQQQQKRHGGNSDDPSLLAIKNRVSDRKETRCAHILVPLLVATTPVLGDFNMDGKLDAAVSISYSGYISSLYLLESFHLPKISLDVFTIEERVKQIYGPTIDDIVDFESFYSVDKQPWSRYMGSKKNCVYD